MIRPTFRDPQLQSELERIGYVRVPLMPPEEAASVVEELQALRPADGFRPDGTGTNRASYHCTFLDDDLAYRKALDELMRRVVVEPMDGVLDRQQLLTSNLYAKAPGAGKLEIHQNWPTSDDIRETSVTVWCPFVDVGPGNGTIQVVPGSHKILPDISTVTAEKYFFDFYDELIDHWLEPISLQAGECLVFDDSLIHWSDDNRSDGFRWCVQSVFMPEECTPVVYLFDAEHEPPRFEMYEVDSGFYYERGISDLIDRPSGLPLHGTLEYQNRRVSEDQFRRILDVGPQTRRAVYAGVPVSEAFAAALAIVSEPAPSLEPATSDASAAAPPVGPREAALADPAPPGDDVPIDQEAAVRQTGPRSLGHRLRRRFSRQPASAPVEAPHAAEATDGPAAEAPAPSVLPTAPAEVEVPDTAGAAVEQELTYLGTWADVDASDLEGYRDAIDRIYAGDLDGMTIRGVFDADEMARMVERTSQYRDEFVDHGKQVMFGTALVGADEDRRAYLDDVWRITDRLPDLFDTDFCARIEGVLGEVGGGRPVEVATEADGQPYVPATIRFLPPGGGVMHAHTANEFCNAWGSYERLRETARMWNSLSYFVVGAEPDDGGELAIYDLGWDDTPDDVLALGMSAERDALLARYPQRMVRPGPGDMILFTGGRIWHRVAPLTGSDQRVTIGGFVALATDEERVLYWS